MPHTSKYQYNFEETTATVYPQFNLLVGLTSCHLFANSLELISGTFFLDPFHKNSPIDPPSLTARDLRLSFGKLSLFCSIFHSIDEILNWEIYNANMARDLAEK